MMTWKERMVEISTQNMMQWAGLMPGHKQWRMMMIVIETNLSWEMKMTSNENREVDVFETATWYIDVNDVNDDDNGGSVNDDDIGAQGGAFEWEFGFALKNFVPPICPADVRFLFWRLKNILHTPPTHSSHWCWNGWANYFQKWLGYSRGHNFF